MNLNTSVLPIEFNNGFILDPAVARLIGEGLASKFQNADPYPHIILDNFISEEVLKKILHKFPSKNLENDKVFESNYSGLHKRQIYPYDCEALIRDFFYFFNSPPVLQFLEGLTGIEGIIPDPYFHGGGLHETTRGGKLGIHADFRIHEKLHIDRRLNLILYLNENWEEAYGGALEIWDRKMKGMVSKANPVFNRCVIFATDATSYHGHPDPLTTPDGVTRRSIALYYYTASKRIYEDTPPLSTNYASRPGESFNNRKQVVYLKFRNFLRDSIPPNLLRVFRGLKDLFNN